MRANQSIKFNFVPLAMSLSLCISGAASISLAQEAQDAKADGTSAQEVETVLDLIPEDAALAIAVPNLERLKARGDRLFDETNAEGFRVSELFTMLYGYLRVQGIVDEQRPAAAIVANLHDLGFENADPNNLLQAVVFRLPLLNVAEAAKRFDLDDNAIATGRIVTRDAASDWPVRQACIRDDYLLLASSKMAIESVLDGQPVAAELSTERRAAAAASDIFVLAGTHSWANGWKEYVNRVESEDFSLGQVPNEKELKRFFRQTVPDTRFALLTATIDDGIHLRLTAQFSQGGTAEAALQAIRGKNASPTNLAALPQGKLLGALAASGDELRTIATARLLAPLALEPIAQTELLQGNDPTQMLGTFAAVLRQLRGVRMALYATDAATQFERSNLGMMAGVFLLEAADVEQVIETIAAEGIVLGGRERAEESERPAPRIAVRRLAKRETIAGHDVDYLEIDTGAMDADAAAALRDAFGPAWMNVRVAPVGDQVVLLLGSDRRLLEQAIEGIDSETSELASSVPHVESAKRLDPGHQAALYVSLQRTLPVAQGVADGMDAMQRDVDRISSAALTVERDLLQIEFWLPLAEIKAIPQELWRFW